MSGIVEITTFDVDRGRDRQTRLLVSEVVGYEECVDHNIRPAVRVLTRGGSHVAVYDTFKTFHDRLAAARGGAHLVISAMDPRDRPVYAAPIPEVLPLMPPAPTPVNTPPHGQIIVEGVNADTRPTTPPTEAPGAHAVSDKTLQVSDVAGAQVTPPKPPSKKK